MNTNARHIPLATGHRKALVFLGIGSILVVLPLNLQAWVLVSAMRSWDIVFTAQAAGVCGMLLLAATFVAPLLLRQPLEQRLKGFVLFWICASIFFNLSWELPLVLFKGPLTVAEASRENLKWFIGWWGYGFADSEYGRVTPFVVVMECWFLIAAVFALAGFMRLRASPRLAYLLFGVCGALQAYNASMYLGLCGVVEGFRNITPDSTLSQILFWGFGLMWPTMGGIAAVLAFRLALRR